MKFGKQLRETITKEWAFYSVDYKAMKKALKQDDKATFFELLEESEMKITKFYQEKESWAQTYMAIVEDRVSELRQVSAVGKPESLTSAPTDNDVSSDDSVSSNEDDRASVSSNAIEGAEDDLDGIFNTLEENEKGSPSIKAEYLRMAASKHFKAYIYAKKSLATFNRELALLVEFYSLNQIAFHKILKKFDKLTGSSIKEQKLAELSPTLECLEGKVFSDLKSRVVDFLDDVVDLKPALPPGWENRKVYTIGCFDLFHRGHQNVLESLREFGCYIVAGIHDDESYFQLKNKYTIDNLETRMKNVKPFADQIYVIPSTDPLLYIQSMVSEQDIISGACCYARGDDMLDFPARPWVESVMPVHFVPRTEACSSTLIRTIYHAEDESLRKKAAFAKTRYDGKPVDENGNVLKLSTPTTPQTVSA